jgi:hypothetical protein
MQNGPSWEREGWLHLLLARDLLVTRNMHSHAGAPTGVQEVHENTGLRREPEQRCRRQVGR